MQRYTFSGMSSHRVWAATDNWLHLQATEIQDIMISVCEKGKPKDCLGRSENSPVEVRNVDLVISKLILGCNPMRTYLIELISELICKGFPLGRS